MSNVALLKTKIFADGADLKSIVALANDPIVKGFTTNPSLMRKDGVTDYEKFACTLLEAVPNKPISFEVFADDMKEMEAQAHKIASWGSNVYVKIPVTNTKGEFTGPLISRLSQAGIALNVTAILTLEQVVQVTNALCVDTSAVVSVFAGRIADTGVDPIPLMTDCIKVMKSKPKAELLWASSRELLNIFQADAIGCHIITVTHDMLKKLSLFGKDLKDYSLETVVMFYKDAAAAGFKINTEAEALT
jgi:transaldolase